MIIYIPTYDRGRTYTAIDTSNARRMPGGSILYFGRLYNGENIYTTPEAVALCWRKEYSRAGKYRVEWPAA